jgi:hypothetical protein
MDVPRGITMKPPRESFISLWRLLIFGIMKTSHYFQQWSSISNFAKDKDFTPGPRIHPCGCIPPGRRPKDESFYS